MSAVGIANEAGGKAVPSLNMPLPAISKPLTETELKEQNMLLARVIASSNNHWATLRQLLDRNASSIIVEGIAAEHSRAAREEAAKKLIMNHIAVLNDVTSLSEGSNHHNVAVPCLSTVLHLRRPARVVSSHLPRTSALPFVALTHHASVCAPPWQILRRSRRSRSGACPEC